jgi:AcrR family transcriptional regulator
MERDRYHHGDLKRALIDQATDAVRAGREPSLRRLAGAVGVSPSAVYRHFADHAALLDAVAAQWLQALGEAMGSALSAAPGDDALQVVTLAYLRAAVTDPHLFRLAAGPHGFGRSGGVLDAGPHGPLPQRHFQAAASPPVAEAAWITTHGLAMLTIDVPYRVDDALALLPRLLARRAS